MDKGVLKILFIEFNAKNVIKIKDALSKASDISYDLYFSSQGEGLLKKVDEEDFDVVLISYELPNANGIEILSDLQ